MADRPEARRHERFPDPVYKETVLRAALRRRQDAPRRRLRAHRPGASASCSPRPGILDREAGGGDRRARSTRSTARSTSATLTYTGEVEDFFFLIETELQSASRTRRRRRLHTGALAQRHRPHAVQAGAQGADRRRCWRGVGICGALIDAAERENGNADRRLHPRPAGAADDLRPLSRRRDRGAAARHRAARGGAAHRRPVRRWARPRSPRRAFRSTAQRVAELLGFAAPLREFLRLHRRESTTSPRPIGARAHVPASRPLRSRTSSSGRASRSGSSMCPNALRADHLDHAAEAQPGADRASAPPRSQTVGRARTMLDVDPQHAVHRHERQRGRDPGGGLRGVRGGAGRVLGCSPGSSAPPAWTRRASAATSTRPASP